MSIRHAIGGFTPAALVLLSSAVCAGTINVNASSPYAAVDGNCALVEAIDNANDDAQTHADCPSGSGPDNIVLDTTIVLDGTTLFPTTSTLNFGSSGLPDINSDITITGGRIHRNSQTPFRFFVVRPSGTLTLERTALVNGSAAGDCGFAITDDATGCGGAIVVDNGTVLVRDSELSGNSADEIIPDDLARGGAIMSFGGSLEIEQSLFSGNEAEHGGAVNTQFGSLGIVDSVFESNVAELTGGAIFNGALVELAIAGSTFEENQVVSPPSSFNGGGAIDNSGSSSRLLVTNSRFLGNTSNNGGAIINNNGSSAEISNSTFVGNGGVTGGAILNQNSTLHVFSSTFSDNTASFFGAAIANGNVATGTAAIAGSGFTGNMASFDGGGIFSKGDLDIHFSTFTGNTAGSDGGAVAVGSATGQQVTVNASSLLGNFAGSDGGGLYYQENPGSTVNELLVSNSLFDDNEADEGGGLFAEVTDVTIVSSTFSNNIASNIGAGGGGGIHLRSFVVTGSSNTIDNTTISGNLAAQDGGGLYINGSAIEVAVASSTIADNTANSSNGGDGIHNVALASVVTVMDSIVSGNGNRNCIDVSTFGVTDDGNNISSDTTCDFDDTGSAGIGDGVDPLLASLADNGGYAPTHALLGGSPAIDNGSGSCGAADQRGASRVAGCDIGAFESQAVPATVSISVDDTEILEADATSTTVRVSVDNTAPGADPVEVTVPLAVTGSASGLGFDYVMSNQNGAGSPPAGQVPDLVFNVADGVSVEQAFTVTAVDDDFGEYVESVSITAGIVGNAVFAGENQVTIEVVSDELPDSDQSCFVVLTVDGVPLTFCL